MRWRLCALLLLICSPGAMPGASLLGSDVEEGEESQILQEAELKVLSRTICKMSLWYSRLLTSNMFCAGYETGGIDACQGDSGGPFSCYIREQKKFYLMGITSFGFGCGHPRFPGIYLRATNYKNWIENVILEDDSSFKHVKFYGLILTVVCLVMLESLL
ncbi:transmembrane protease serine 12 [Microcaecilia unicolor]|uniref:Transmembrane protease serine 12-like n=1 Tax=Microcaecilia unicolor TaxID=1415580 RepID=A0A6P7X5H9_9AMPH|nr:transmembrane protease serine 12-like [Microcaecilia unicolor]